MILCKCITSGPFFAAWIIFAKLVEQTRAGFGGDPQQPKVSETWTCPRTETHLSVPFLGFMSVGRIEEVLVSETMNIYIQ